MIWINVNDAMPELCKNVLIAVREYKEPFLRVSIGYTSDLHWGERPPKDATAMWVLPFSSLTDEDLDHEGEKIIRVFYWMPLPDSPLVPHSKEQE
jgi:Protein of unknown function (DUF551)